MKIAFFLLPKSEVVYLPAKSTMRQALEKMEYHGYTAVPIINDEGKYVGTITEGDLLWKLKNTNELSFKDAETISLIDIPQRMKNNPVQIDVEVEDLLSLAIVQNFIPVVDDNGIFIGIVRRSEIFKYLQGCYQMGMIKPFQGVPLSTGWFRQKVSLCEGVEDSLNHVE